MFCEIEHSATGDYMIATLKLSLQLSEMRCAQVSGLGGLIFVFEVEAQILPYYKVLV